jgi:replicative superfamily II helicase
MIRIITKEDQSILFNKEEIKFSTFLNNMFFNKQFYNNEDSDNSCEDSCEDSENKNVKELKIDKLSIQSLVKIKAIIQYVLEKKIDDYKNNNKLKKIIQISKYFSLKDFFELLEVVNYLHIELIINVMVNYIKQEIEDDTIMEIKKTFNLTDDDFTGDQLKREELFNKITCDY